MSLGRTVGTFPSHLQRTLKIRSGELVCFFRAPPRIVRNPMNEMSASPATTPASRSSPSAQRLFQSPALLSDAVRRLDMAAIDRDRLLDSLPQSSSDNDTTMRIMTNLLTFSHHHHHKRRESMVTSASSLPTANPNYAKVPVLTRRSTVFIEGPTDTIFAQRKVAEAYVFGHDGESVGATCEANAKIAHEHGQWSHERVWRTLRGLFPASVTKGAGPTKIAQKIIDSLYVLVLRSISSVNLDTPRYKEYCASHDVQMLAMLGIILLRAFASLPDTGKPFYSLIGAFPLIISQCQIHLLQMTRRQFHQPLKKITSRLCGGVARVRQPSLPVGHGSHLHLQQLRPLWLRRSRCLTPPAVRGQAFSILAACDSLCPACRKVSRRLYR